MTILIDANLLLRLVETQSPRSAEAFQAVRLLGQQHSLIIVPQVVYEFWAVATRTLPANGLGMSVIEADQALQEMLEFFPLIPDEQGILDHWRSLVRHYGVKGVKSYDTRLVAAMKQHGLTHLLTFNAGDFTRYSGITVLTPEAVIQGQ
ncbi:type II toxin-antitoxin system VapC family toxin [Planctomicrobium sp. SH668]|uniref:type II toxin-antitoxin system VapC family toxin n=1 Tax=Planctomicrobium sp. SH668 TaxID=3448126 RepID=UPI003F5C12C7